MNCAQCDKATQVLDTRTFAEGKAVKRRRECLFCSHRFSTYEYSSENEVIMQVREIIKGRNEALRNYIKIAKETNMKIKSIFSETCK